MGRLTGLGLNEQQARAYLSLLDVETATANELARSSRVPRAKLYEVLESLSRKGLLEIIPDSPQRFRANALTSLFDMRLEELRAEEQTLKRTIGEMMLQFLPQPKDAAAATERDFLHFSRGRTVFVNHVKQLADRTEKNLVVFGDSLFLARLRIHEDLLPRLRRIVEKGRLRILVPQNVVSIIEGRRVHVDELSDVVRVVPMLGGDAMWAIRDETEILEAHFLPNDLHPSRGSDRVIINRDAEIASMRTRVFDTLWDLATPYVRGVARA